MTRRKGIIFDCFLFLGRRGAVFFFLPSLEIVTGVAVAAAARGMRAKAVRGRPRPGRGKKQK
jgi:hypothetical protein